VRHDDRKGRGAMLSVLVSIVIAACGAVDASTAPPGSIPTAAAGEQAAASGSAEVAEPSSATANPSVPPPARSNPTLSPSPSPTPTPTPTPTHAVPPKPTGVEFKEHLLAGQDPSLARVTQSVSWAAPRSADVEIKVYGVTECIARPDDPEPNEAGPCLVTGTRLPASVRTLLATAPASDGTVSWSWTGTFDCGEPQPLFDPAGPDYHAIVVAAYDAAGHSIFAIAAPGRWWEPDPNDIIC
jgi:hypothetical protein